MTPSCLTLLEDDAVARRLVAAWPKAGPWKGDGSVMRRWANLAGVGVREALSRREMLFGNEICFEDGRVDRVAEQYVARLAMARFPTPRERAKEGQRREEGKDEGGGSKPQT